MAMTVQNKISDETAEIKLSGRFDFSSHRDFRQGYEEILNTSGLKQLVLDMDSVEYIDSSALGMLLLLREKALNVNLDIILKNCRGPVRQVLEVANFNRLFKIE